MKAPNVATPKTAPPAAQAAASTTQSTRRSSRITMAISVAFFGQSQEGRIFGEHCRTTTVSAHGASILVSKAVDKNKPVLIVNSRSKVEARSRIVHQRAEKGGFEIGIEFVEPNASFWGFFFPPENGDPSERKRPVATEANSAAGRSSESKRAAK
jgi:hypothetical protein